MNVHPGTIPRFPCLLTALFCALFIFAGCTGTSESDYLPTTASARGALEASLEAWKSGAALSTITTTGVPIDTFDARWRDGKRLSSYEIVREEIVDGRPTFVVTVQITGEPAPVEDTFLVVGNNPLMVFRKQDFDKAGGTGG